MLFFRSEDCVVEWCRERRLSVGPILRIDQLWGLATAWYGSRLQPDSRRPDATEMRQIFAGLGLYGTFWDPHADRLG